LADGLDDAATFGFGVRYGFVSELREPNKELNRLASAVIGAAIEVHRQLGPGLLEYVYEEALSVELALRAVHFARQVPQTIVYKGVEIGQARLDLLVEDRLVVELKSCESLLPLHTAQLLSYLQATHLTLGLLINRNVPLVHKGIRRVVRTY
jgi:GxxExxY protein